MRGRDSVQCFSSSCALPSQNAAGPLKHAEKADAFSTRHQSPKPHQHLPETSRQMTSKSAVESGEFPILCETCLGPNPYVRMLEETAGRECKVCERPFRCHSWRPSGHGMRPKKTEICQTCARLKNVCQTCLLDLQYNLPVQVRDLALPAVDRQATVMPKSEATREYAAAQADRAIENGEIAAVYARKTAANSIAERAKRTAPKYERNLARICTFFVRGECTRGLYCPYRHEMPKEGSDGMGEQNLRDRYYGVNDPVAAKIIRKVNEEKGFAIDAPADKSIQTLFIGGVGVGVSEGELRALFGADAGIANVNILVDKCIAFVDFVSRDAAEKAYVACNGQRKIGENTVNVRWGRSRSRFAPPRAAPDAEHPPSKRHRSGNGPHASGAGSVRIPGISRQENGQSSAVGKG